ncbi:MAG TPA: hypothetical protein VML55_13660 [Planctomycetaceae bacterium]|nr:hypothetical protein [Planctomycetaceae bacterium]
MSQPNTHPPFRLGFLAAVELPGRGHVGGLLVTNHLGRPLEFQCTAPVKANRTQEILYGPTLVPYLLCDLIGRTLLDKVGVKPQLVLVDDPRLVELRAEVDVPVAVLSLSTADADSGDTIDPPLDPGTPARAVLGRQAVAYHPSFAADAEMLEQARNRLPPDADLSEPFARVREALRETMGAAA